MSENKMGKPAALLSLIDRTFEEEEDENSATLAPPYRYVEISEKVYTEFKEDIDIKYIALKGVSIFRCAHYRLYKRGMTRGEAIRVIEIFLEVDGGCSQCAKDAIKDFVKKFPEWELLAKIMYNEKFDESNHFII